MIRARYFALTLVAGLLGCAGGDDALAGRVYLRSIPRDELVGGWSPRRHPPTLLQSLFLAKRSTGPEVLTLSADQACVITPDLAQHLVRCEYVSEVAAPTSGGCAWSIESYPEGEGEGLVIVFQAPGGKWQTTRFGVFRHTANGDIALFGTCGSGDAYGLFRS